jgi:hypothetical protein
MYSSNTVVLDDSHSGHPWSFTRQQTHRTSRAETDAPPGTSKADEHASSTPATDYGQPAANTANAATAAAAAAADASTTCTNYATADANVHGPVDRRAKFKRFDTRADPNVDESAAADARRWRKLDDLIMQGCRPEDHVVSILEDRNQVGITI